MMNNIEETLFSAFAKIKGNDILDSVLADCENGGNIIMVDKMKRKPIWAYVGGFAAAAAVIVICAVSVMSGIGTEPKIRNIDSFVNTESDSDISARVCLDVNPSIEIAVNNSEKVVDVIANNSDGENIINGTDFKGNGLEDAVKTLVNRMVDERYINESENSILVSVSAKNQNFGESLEKKMSDEIYGFLSSEGINGAVLSQTIADSDDELTKLAKMFNISVGRAKMIKDIIDSEKHYTFEKLASMSVNDLSLIRESIGSKTLGISITGEVYSYYITVEEAVEAALNGNSKSDVSDVRVMLESWQEGDASLIYHVAYTLADGEECSCYIHAVTGKIISTDKSGIESEYPIVPEEYAKEKAIEFICDFDGVSADTIKVVDCVVTYDPQGVPRQYVTIDSLTDENVTYYVYIYDESITVGNSGNVYGGRLAQEQKGEGLTVNEALNIVLEKSGRKYSDFGYHFEVEFGSAKYYRFYFITDDWGVLWFVNKDTKELLCGCGECYLTKYGGDGTEEEIVQFAINQLSNKPHDFDLINTQAVSFERVANDKGVKYYVTLRDNTPGRESNIAFVHVNVVEQDAPEMKSNDELLEIISKELGISKTEFADIKIDYDDHRDMAHIHFAVDGMDYLCVLSTYAFADEKIVGMSKKLQGEDEYPIIPEDKAIENALKCVGKTSIDEVESCEVKYDSVKKEYTVSIIEYGSKYGKTVFWEFCFDAYTGIQLSSKFDDSGDYGAPNIKTLSEQEAVDVALRYLESYGYQRDGMKVSVETEELKRKYPLNRYYITAIDNVTVFTMWVNADETNPSGVDTHIDFEAVKLGKTGKYISEDIAKEIAVCGMKDFYTVKSINLDESGDLAVYEVTIARSGLVRTLRISAESGMVIESKNGY